MRFCIIDVSNLVHRAKHGMKARDRAAPGDMFGEDDDIDRQEELKSMLITMVFMGMQVVKRKFNPDHFVMTFDDRSWRRDVYPEYKDNRRSAEKTPEELADKESIKEVINLLEEYLRDYTNCTVLRTHGAEADDFIARWIQLHADPIFTHIIVSSDGDFKQLVAGNVDLYNPISHTLFTSYGVFYQDGRKVAKGTLTASLYDEVWKVKMDKTGESPLTFDPKWELFEKCIRGDASDNIKSSYPRVHKTKMAKAFYGDVVGWNNFINSTWGHKDSKHTVRDKYEFNRLLIDLTKQPDDVISSMDQAVEDALNHIPRAMIGAQFNKFCTKYQLTKLRTMTAQLMPALMGKY